LERRRRSASSDHPQTPGNGSLMGEEGARAALPASWLRAGADRHFDDLNAVPREDLGHRASAARELGGD